MQIVFPYFSYLTPSDFVCIERKLYIIRQSRLFIVMSVRFSKLLRGCSFFSPPFTMIHTYTYRISNIFLSPLRKNILWKFSLRRKRWTIWWSITGSGCWSSQVHLNKGIKPSPPLTFQTSSALLIRPRHSKRNCAYPWSNRASLWEMDPYQIRAWQQC